MSDKKPRGTSNKSTDDNVVVVRTTTSASESADASAEPVHKNVDPDGSATHTTIPVSETAVPKKPLVQRLLPSGLKPTPRAERFWTWPKLASAMVAILLLGGATYAGVVYMSNTPEYVYARGVENSGKLIDDVAAYAQQLQSAPYKSTTFDGNMQGRDVLGHYDIDLSGTENRNGDGLFTASGDVDGMTLSSNIRTVAVAGSTLPDAYVKSKDLNALKPLIGVEGLPTFNQFDNKWILVDHNLLESYADNLMRIADKHINKNEPSPTPTLAQLSDALAKVQAVSKRYLFTTNSATAVFRQSSFLGTEENDGRQLNHYRVTYNAAHLTAFLQAFSQALDSSQLNAWSQRVSQGKSLSQTLDLGTISSATQQQNRSANAADVWIDRDSKIITSVQFNNPTPTLSSIVVTQGYNGNKVYPFTVTYNGKDKNGTTYKSTASFALNANTGVTTLAFNNRSQTGSLLDVLNVHMSLKPSNDTVQVSAPSGAVPFLTALGPSGLSDLAKP